MSPDPWPGVKVGTPETAPVVITPDPQGHGGKGLRADQFTASAWRYRVAFLVENVDGASEDRTRHLAAVKGSGGVAPDEAPDQISTA